MGVTVSKSVAGISVGAELSYRQNMPLVSNLVTVLPAPLVNPALGQYAVCPQGSNVPLPPGVSCLPTEGTPGALGDTYHGLINALGVLPKTPLFDTASYQAEMTWMHWAKVTQNMAVFKGNPNYLNPDGSNPIDKVSKDFIGLAFNFTPTWFQVFPGVDLLAPISWGGGVSGNSAVTAGGWKNAGSYAFGIAADIYQKYRVDLKYAGYYGNYTTTAATGAVNTFNGTPAVLSDRGWISLTFKTTF
jgi:Protein of unknown function (DUF1302)